MPNKNKSVKWLNCMVAALACALVMGVLGGCSSGGGSDVNTPVKLGTDTLPQAPGQGTPPGQIGADGKPTAPAAGLPLPGNKGKHPG